MTCQHFCRNFFELFDFRLYHVSLSRAKDRESKLTSDKPYTSAGTPFSS